MRRLFTLLFVLLCTTPAFAQLSSVITTTTCPGAGCFAVTVNGAGTVGVQITGTFAATLEFEQSIDAANWVSWSVLPTGSATEVTSATAPGIWTGRVAGLNKVRIRASAYTSGTATVSAVTAVAMARKASSGGGPTPNTNTYDSYRGDATFGHAFPRGTITTSDPFGWSQTWNDGSVVFDGITLDVTRTASSSAYATGSNSSMFKVRDGGTSNTMFSVENDPSFADRSMLVFNAGGDLDANSNNVAFHTTAGFLAVGTGNGGLGTRNIFVGRVNSGGNWGGLADTQLASSGVLTHKDGSFGWSGGTSAENSTDTGLQRYQSGIVRATTGSTLGGGIAVGDTAANSPQPTCDSTSRGTFWSIFGGAGVKDAVQVCAKDAGDAYAWRSIF